MDHAVIMLDDVWVEYAIYGVGNRSLKKTIVQKVSRGRLAHEVTEGLSRVVALKGVSLYIRDGDRVGLIGANGAGKTTLLRVMAGTMKPARGWLRRVGMTSSLFDVSLGMNSEANGWDNIMLRGLFLGLSPVEVRARTEEIVEFSGLTHDQLSRPVRTYSSGMLLRLAFAISTSVYPDILLLDEWLSVGDAQFTEKAQQRMTDLVQNARILVIASHNDYLIRSVCTKAVYLEAGRVAAEGPVEDALALYHGYPQAVAS